MKSTYLDDVTASANGARRHRARPTRFLRVVSTEDTLRIAGFAEWAEWQAPYDRVTRLMLTCGDFPPGLRVTLDGQLYVVRGNVRQRLEAVR